MVVTEQELNKYLKQIKKRLVCKGAQRKAFVASFEDNLEEYLKANPKADFAQLQNDMGTPEEIADAFLENESASRIKRCIVLSNLVKSVIAVLLLVLTIFIANELIEIYQACNGFGIESIGTPDFSAIISEK